MSVAGTIAPTAVQNGVEVWMDDAECVGNWELFFPDHGDPSPAKRICEGCPVRAACLAHALACGEWYGIWGGMTPGERRSHLRLRRRHPADGAPDARRTRTGASGPGTGRTGAGGPGADRSGVGGPGADRSGVGGPG